MRSRSASVSGGSFNSDRKSRTCSSAAAAAKVFRRAGPAPPEDTAETEAAVVVSTFATTRRAVSTAITGLASARIERALKRSLLGGQEPLHDTGEPLRRRKEHRDPHGIIGRVVGGKERRPLDRRGEDFHQRRREWKGDDRNER